MVLYHALACSLILLEGTDYCDLPPFTSEKRWAVKLFSERLQDAGTTDLGWYLWRWQDPWEVGMTVKVGCVLHPVHRFVLQHHTWYILPLYVSAASEPHLTLLGGPLRLNLLWDTFFFSLLMFRLDWTFKRQLLYPSILSPDHLMRSGTFPLAWPNDDWTRTSHPVQQSTGLPTCSRKEVGK